MILSGKIFVWRVPKYVPVSAVTENGKGREQLEALKKYKGEGSG